MVPKLHSSGKVDRVAYELDISLKDTVSDAKPDLVTCLSGVARFRTVGIADVSSSSLHGQPL